MSQIAWVGPRARPPLASSATSRVLQLVATGRQASVTPLLKATAAAGIAVEHGDIVWPWTDTETRFDPAAFEANVGLFCALRDIVRIAPHTLSRADHRILFRAVRVRTTYAVPRELRGIVRAAVARDVLSVCDIPLTADLGDHAAYTRLVTRTLLGEVVAVDTTADPHHAAVVYRPMTPVECDARAIDIINTMARVARPSQGAHDSIDARARRLRLPPYADQIPTSLSGPRIVDFMLNAHVPGWLGAEGAEIKVSIDCIMHLVRDMKRSGDILDAWRAIGYTITVQPETMTEQMAALRAELTKAASSKVRRRPFKVIGCAYGARHTERYAHMEATVVALVAQAAIAMLIGDQVGTDVCMTGLRAMFPISTRTPSPVVVMGRWLLPADATHLLTALETPLPSDEKASWQTWCKYHSVVYARCTDARNSRLGVHTR
jgi:hypothetical protein